MIRWPEYVPPSLCCFITPVIAAIGEGIADLGIGAAAAGGVAAAGDVAAVTLPEVAVTAAAPAAAAGIGAGDVAATLAAGAGAADLGATLAAPAATATGIPTAPTTATGTPPTPTVPSTLVAPGAPSPLPGGPSAVSGPTLGAPAAPASVAATPPAAPGGGTINDIVAGTGGGGPGDQVASLAAPPAQGATPASDAGSMVSGNAASNLGDQTGSGVGATAPGPLSSGSGSGAGSSNLFGSAGTAVNKFVADNPLVLPAAGLGASLFMDSKSIPGQKQISGEAGNLNAQGQQLEQYLQTGTLPPGVQQGINQATDSAIAAIKSRYASTGGSGSSAEQQDIANAQEVAQSQGAAIAMQLLNTGISETGMAAQLYQYLSSAALNQDQALGSALANFAGSVARPTITLNTTAAAG